MFSFYSTLSRAMETGKTPNFSSGSSSSSVQKENTATAASAKQPCVKRLLGLGGFDGRKNDVIFTGPMNDGMAAIGGQGHVVYFPGDIQNYPEQMELHTTNRLWVKWNLDDIAVILSRRFPYSYIWVVKPTRLHLNTFSCFDNFVTGDTFGGPEFSADHGALRHLQALLVSAISETFSRPGSQTTRQEPGPTDQCDLEEVDLLTTLPVTLVGFSKGCVVLNQILHELGSTGSDPVCAEMLKQVTDIYWLDGGHNRREYETYITDGATLRNLGDTMIRVHNHMTPFQARNPDKPHIGRQARKFVTTLKTNGVDVSDSLHFDDEGPSLENHFKILEVF